METTITPIIPENATDSQRELIDRLGKTITFSGKNKTTLQVPKAETESWLAEQGITGDTFKEVSRCIGDIDVALTSFSSGVAAERIKEAAPKTAEERKAIPSITASAAYYDGKSISKVTPYRNGVTRGVEWENYGIVSNTTEIGLGSNADTMSQYADNIRSAFGLD